MRVKAFRRKKTTALK